MDSVGIMMIVTVHVGSILPIDTSVNTCRKEVRLRAGRCFLHGLKSRGFHSANVCE